jgi:hypothetical protein
MKLLFENWRRFLNEGLDPRIQKQLDALFALPDVGVAIIPDGAGGMGVMYVRIEDAETQQFSELTDEDSPYGGVDIGKAEPELEGPCLSGYIILSTKAERGWGPLLYEVALEWASQEGGGLTPDRETVSGYAKAVWDKYQERFPDAAQLDIDLRSPPADDIQQITPDDPSDDCQQDSAWQDMSGDWQDSSLSKLYRKETAEVMQALKDAGRLIEV